MTGLNAVARSHKIIELLVRRFYDGLSNKELAAALNTSAANISRDLKQLEGLGYTRQLDNGRWSLTAKPVALNRAFTSHFNLLLERMEESERNIKTLSRQYGGCDE